MGIINESFKTEPIHIYVIENDTGYIKIGVTKNFKQRLEALSGSNTGGNKLTRYWVSPETVLYTFERALHCHFQDHRIKGTEWFKDLNFDETICYVQQQMQSQEFKRCEEARKQYYKTIQ